MNILFPIGFLYPAENGGPALTIYWITQEMYKRGIDFSLISTTQYTNDKVISNRWINTEYGKVIYLKTTRPSISLKFILFTIFNIKRFDIVVLTSIFAFSSLIFTLTCLFKNKKVILSPRGELDEKALVYNSFMKKLVLKIYKIIPTENIVFHATSQKEKYFIQRGIPNKINIVIIPNFIRIPELLIHNINDNYYFLFLGRFHEKKAIENLILALTLSKTFRDSKFKLKLAGNYQTPYGLKIQKYASELGLDKKVEFIGEQKGPDKEILYASAYCTVVPSHTENFCNVILESLCQGTPVIASNGTPWESLNENKIGYWMSNDSETIAKYIDIMISLDSNEYLKMRNEARKYAEKHFDIKVGVDEWITLFKNVLSR